MSSTSGWLWLPSPRQGTGTQSAALSDAGKPMLLQKGSSATGTGAGTRFAAGIKIHRAKLVWRTRVKANVSRSDPIEASYLIIPLPPTDHHGHWTRDARNRP